MDSLLFFIVGALLMWLILQRPLQITVHHKNENIIPEIPDVAIPKMSEVTGKADPDEDQTYEEMGKIMDNVQEIFGGSDRS
jgi:hypothetical protein